MSTSSKQQNEEGAENLLPGKHAADLGVLHPNEALSLVFRTKHSKTYDSITLISLFFQNITISFVCNILSCRAPGPTQCSHPQHAAGAATFLSCLQ